jgi:hypothetical protein
MSEDYDDEHLSNDVRPSMVLTLLWLIPALAYVTLRYAAETVIKLGQR